MTSQFLPITKAEAAARGWDQLDFVYIIGDAYVDHPSFGAAIISRVIESLGFSIGIISQPGLHGVWRAQIRLSGHRRQH